MALSILLWTLYIIGAYCILCWVIGFALCFAGKLNIDSAMPNIKFVIAAILPIMIIDMFYGWLEYTKYKFH